MTNLYYNGIVYPEILPYSPLSYLPSFSEEVMLRCHACALRWKWEWQFAPLLSNFPARTVQGDIPLYSQPNVNRVSVG